MDRNAVHQTAKCNEHAEQLLPSHTTQSYGMNCLPHTSAHSLRMCPHAHHECEICFFS